MYDSTCSRSAKGLHAVTENKCYGLSESHLKLTGLQVGYLHSFRLFLEVPDNR